MKWFGIVIGSVIAAGGIAVIVGFLLPTKHVVSRMARYRQPPEALWDVLTDYGGASTWRPDIRTVERMPDRDGHAVWTEVDTHGQVLPLETLEELPTRRLVRRVADPTLPFGGTWTYEIAPFEGGSTVTITERGEIRNPVYRLAARFVFGYAATLEAYLRALGRRFGEEVSVS
jgi:hypothetical protein